MRSSCQQESAGGSGFSVQEGNKRETTGVMLTSIFSEFHLRGPRGRTRGIRSSHANGLLSLSTVEV